MLTFRFVPRALGHILGLSQPWQFLVMQAMFGIVFLWAFAHLCERATGDRLSAALLTIGLASTWAGACAWLEVRGNFDAIALALVALALLARRLPLVVLLWLTASFVDERSLLLLPILFLAPQRPSTEQRSARAILVAIGVIAAFHLLIQTELTSRLHLLSSTSRQAGTVFYQKQEGNAPVAWWNALEGLWLIVAAGLITSWRRGQRWRPAIIVATLAVVCTSGLFVLDISRAISFAALTVPAAARGLADLPLHWRRRASTWAAAICVLVPTLYVSGESSVQLGGFPLPVEIFLLVRR